MGAKFKYFDRGNILSPGGSPMAELQDGGVTVTNGFQEVIAMLGYLGGSKGVVMGTITWKRAVPRAGFEKSADVVDAVINQTPITVMAIVGAYKFTVTGVPTQLGRSIGAQTTSTEDTAVHGDMEVEKI